MKTYVPINMLNKAGFIIKELRLKNWYLVRLYADKINHPIGYRIKFPFKIIQVEQGTKMIDKLKKFWYNNYSK